MFNRGLKKIFKRRLRWLGHAARRSDNSMVKQLIFATRVPGQVQPVRRPRGTWIVGCIML